MKTVQEIHAEIEWRRMRDQEKYYALRDGPRMQVSWWCISRLAKHLSPEDVWLANWLMELRRKMASASVSDTCERVQSSTSDHGLRMSNRIKAYAGYQGAVLMNVGRDAYACLDGITDVKVLDRNALAARVNYSPRSKRSLIRLVQITMEAAQAHHQEKEQARAA